MDEEIEMYGGFDEPAAEPEPEVEAQPSVDLNEYNATKGRLEAMERKWNDFQTFFTGDSNQGPTTPDDLLAMFVNDPRGFRDDIISEVDGRASARLRAQQLEQEYISKHPDKVAFKDEIYGNALKIYREAESKGTPMDDRAAIDRAIQDFDTRVAAYSQQKSSGDRVRHLALNPGTGSSAQPGQRTPTSKEIWSMPREEFRKLEAQRGYGYNSDFYE